jgi:hypothetical protein
MRKKLPDNYSKMKFIIENIFLLQMEFAWEVVRCLVTPHVLSRTGLRGFVFLTSLSINIFLCLVSSFCSITRIGILWLSRSRVIIGFNADLYPDIDPGFAIPSLDKIYSSSLSLEEDWIAKLLERKLSGFESTHSLKSSMGDISKGEAKTL